MNDLQLLISVTISEFDVLRDLGVLRVDPSRIVVTRLSKSTGYGSEVDAQLLAKLPEFLPSDEQSVLILVFHAPLAPEPSDDAITVLLSGRVTLSARNCTQVIPLTRRAREILSGRLSGQVVLDEPLFEDLIEGHLAHADKQSSRFGAVSVVEALVENHGQFRWDRLHDAMEDRDHPLRSLLDSIIRFTRHKPMPREPISGLRDLGGLLKESAVEERELPLKQLGEWLRPKQDDLRGFRKVYSDSVINGILARIARAWDLPVSAAGLAIFLHWRELALRAGGVDLDAVALDCQDLAGCMDGQAVVEALWLLGFSSGFEAVAPGCYRRMGDKHPFNPTGRSGKRITLLSLPSVAMLEAPVASAQAPESPVSATQAGQGDASKPDKERNDKVNATSEAEEPVPEKGPAEPSPEPDKSSDMPPEPVAPEPTPNAAEKAAGSSEGMRPAESIPTSPPDDAASGPSQPEPAKKKATKRKKPSAKTREEPPAEAGDGELFPDNP